MERSKCGKKAQLKIPKKMLCCAFIASMAWFCFISTSYAPTTRLIHEIQCHGPNHRKKARASHKLLLFVYFHFHTICAKEICVIFGPTNYVTQPCWPMSLGCVYGLVDLVMVVGVRGKHKLRMDQKHFPAMAACLCGPSCPLTLSLHPRRTLTLHSHAFCSPFLPRHCGGIGIISGRHQAAKASKEVPACVHTFASVKHQLVALARPGQSPPSSTLHSHPASGGHPGPHHTHNVHTFKKKALGWRPCPCHLLLPPCQEVEIQSHQPLPPPPPSPITDQNLAAPGSKPLPWTPTLLSSSPSASRQNA